MSSEDQSSVQVPKSVTVKIGHAVPPTDGSPAKAYTYVNPATGVRDVNFTSEQHDTVIENVRGEDGQYTLDITGFQFYREPATHTTFLNDEEVQTEYYPESVELFKKLTGASKVVIFDHTIRRRCPDQVGEIPQTRQPVNQAHVDQTLKASIARVHRHLPTDEAPALLKKRFQIVNLWRPIKHAALDWPLALCDFRSVDPAKDTLPVALIFPEREGETYGIKYSPDYKWKYLRGMTPEEIVLIKCYDSIQDGSVAQFTPHTAFEDPTTPVDAPLRESIELRALAFYD